MKTTAIIAIYAVLGIHLASAQYTAVPDLNFEAYLEDNGMGDGIPGNGLVLTANIENVTELLLQGNMGITDLTGIEDFAALETFYCAYNPVTEVDLSQNVNLTHVGFASANLTTLDLSNNTKLEYAGGLYNLRLHYVIVNSPYITEIEFWENAIIDIDITNCPALENINLYYNWNLPSLDISGNPNLKILWCGENNLTSLDTSNNPLLEVLSIGNNPNLTSLDLSQNPLLRSFSAGQNNSMTFIDIRNGNNEHIDSFSANPADNLQCVYVDDASAPYLEDWRIPENAQFANNEQECTPLSVAGFEKTTFQVYPNPATENVKIISKSGGFYRVYAAEGKELDSGKIDKEVHIISLSDYSSGLYYIELTSDHFREIKKVVKN
jgi:hypothetical protein